MFIGWEHSRVIPAAMYRKYFNWVCVLQQKHGLHPSFKEGGKREARFWPVCFYKWPLIFFFFRCNLCKALFKFWLFGQEDCLRRHKLWRPYMHILMPFWNHPPLLVHWGSISACMIYGVMDRRELKAANYIRGANPEKKRRNTGSRNDLLWQGAPLAQERG